MTTAFHTNKPNALDVVQKHRWKTTDILWTGVCFRQLNSKTNSRDMHSTYPWINRVCHEFSNLSLAIWTYYMQNYAATCTGEECNESKRYYWCSCVPHGFLKRWELSQKNSTISTSWKHLSLIALDWNRAVSIHWQWRSVVQLLKHSQLSNIENATTISDPNVAKFQPKYGEQF